MRKLINLLLNRKTTKTLQYFIPVTDIKVIKRLAAMGWSVVFKGIVAIVSKTITLST